MIIDSLYDYTIIKKEMIIKSFMVTRIYNYLDGSEDEELIGTDKIMR